MKMDISLDVIAKKMYNRVGKVLLGVSPISLRSLLDNL